MIDKSTNNRLLYTPNFLDALKIFWSFMWRVIPITIIFIFALVLLGAIMKLIGLKELVPPLPFILNEHDQLVFAYKTPFSIFCFQFSVFIFQWIVGFLAFKDLIKAKYSTFVFDTSQITYYHLLSFVFIINSFDTLFSYFAGSRVQSLIAYTFFIGIQLFVKCALIQHVISSGFFRGKWKIYLPVLQRDDVT